MTLIIVTMLILAYVLIATGHLTGVNKAAIAMFLGTVGWVIYVCWGADFVADQHPLDYQKSKSSRKASTVALLTMAKPLTVGITINCGKF